MTMENVRDSSSKKVILDRDGVLNPLVINPEHGSIDSPLHSDEASVFPWVPQALAKLQRLGYTLAVATNQPAAAKRKTTRENLERVHEKILNLAQQEGGVISGSFICWHRAEDGCNCRKPKPGLLDEALRMHPSAAPSSSWMVGDGLTDMQAAKSRGLRSAFIGPWKTDIYKVLSEHNALPDLWCRDLAEFAEAMETQNLDGKNMFAKSFLQETVEIIQKLKPENIDHLAQGLAGVKAAGGRLFILGVGGSAGHASHAVNDFRKICGIEAYAPTDNVSELTARINDDGWDGSLASWLQTSRLKAEDGILIFSVGGGNLEKNISVNLVRSIELAQKVGAKVFGIVGRDGGFTAKNADACVVIPPLFESRITPHTEGLCAVVWHLLVSHPNLAVNKTKWESSR